MEIERKFLVKDLPEGWEQFPQAHIVQAYISTDPVIRVRKTDERCTLTVKGQGRLAREELNLPLSRESYERLLKKAEGRIIEKTRCLIPCPPYTIELDLFAGDLAPLRYAEVEFPTEEEALAFIPPDWFGRDVTFEPGYSNADLSKGP